jgi:hypothetical protein
VEIKIFILQLEKGKPDFLANLCCRDANKKEKAIRIGLFAKK